MKRPWVTGQAEVTPIQQVHIVEWRRQGIPVVAEGIPSKVHPMRGRDEDEEMAWVVVRSL